jgi:hypothetical protein
MRQPLLRTCLLLTVVAACAWLGVLLDAASTRWAPDSARWAVTGVAIVLSLAWLIWARGTGIVARAAAWTGAFVVAWQATIVGMEWLGWPVARATAAQYGLAGFFLIGLAWVVWLLERASRHFDRIADLPDHHTRGPRAAETSPKARVSNPLSTRAWYYGYGSRKLNQSLTALSAYSLSFLLACLVISQIQGCKETYELPAGGGQQQKAVVQTVRIQKIKKKKFVINPFSAIVFNPPPIDDVSLKLTELTQHAYKVGFGQGEGAGFGGGTKLGKVRFIRLEYTGGDWNQDFGVGADLNMLIEYGVRTGQKTHDQTESRTIAQLNNFPAGKSPPLLYMTGQQNISLSKTEVKTLREYLTDKHGMLLGDNGGSAHFHNQFFAMMNQVLPNVKPVEVPADDVIHRMPFSLPLFPYVAPHGGKKPWGWKIDGRWVCYYHPGDIGDAWSDGHAGLPREVWEACYQLGTNIIFYAHMEYAKWLVSQEKS